MEQFKDEASTNLYIEGYASALSPPRHTLNDYSVFPSPSTRLSVLRESLVSFELM